jgi:hypothetical protein
MQSALPNQQLKFAKPIATAISLRGTFGFLMLGGGSILLMIVFFFMRLPQVVMQDQTRALIQQGGSIAMISALIFSYPHFIWSYRFAYQQGGAFIRRHSLSLLIFPVMMALSLFVCVITWNQPVNTMPILIAIDNQLRFLGVDLQWTAYHGIGQLLMALFLIAQTIAAGHHYCMQAFGVALASGEDCGYKLSPERKKILSFNLYALWVMNLLSGYSFFSILNSSSFMYLPPQFPAPLQMASTLVFALSVIALFVRVILPLRREQKKLPPLLAAVPILSIWVWLQPFCQPYGFQAWVVPLAHGAQYIWFACRAEGNIFAGKTAAPARFRATRHLAIITLATIVLGYLAFYYVPLLLNKTHVLEGVTTNFFLLALLFISMHHYAIDTVVWKADSRARKSLRKAPS